MKPGGKGMGLLGNIIRGLVSETSASQQYQKSVYEPQKRYTPEEYVIYEQEQSGKSWYGVPLSELSKLAQTVYHGKYCKIDQYNFLVFSYTSNSRKTSFSAQCEIDENGRLCRLPHGYYPGQWRDSADDFVEKANQYFTFR